MTRKTELKLLGFALSDESDPRHAIRQLLKRRLDPPRPDEARMVAYLRSAQPFIVSPGVEFDLLDGSGPIGSGSILTDSEHAWPDVLAHYLEAYHIELPEEFWAAVAARGFMPPALSIQQLRTLMLPGVS